MFRNLLKRLFEDGPASPPLTSPDAEMALAALMIRVARADDRYSEAEQRVIDTILGRRNASLRDIAERRAAAEMIEAEAPDTVRLTRIIKERVPLAERDEILEHLWEVVHADGRRDAEEDAAVRLVAGLLGVRDRDSALARQRVAR